VLLEKAHSLAQEWGGAPVVIAGDFNSTPLVRFAV
jgi:endonuclease/exonuclease/phosphatase family metal-dependent hydrolase